MSNAPDRSRGNADTQTDLEFVLIDRFSMMSFIAAIEPLRVANRILGREAYRWRFYSQDGQAVEASNGIALAVDGRIGSGPQPQFTFVCAGLNLEAQHQSRLNAFLVKRYENGGYVGAISMGSFFLARAGLLQGRRCTVHWEGEPTLREVFPDIELTRTIYELDGRIMTCSGGMASFEMILSIIARDHSAATLRAIANQLQLDQIRPQTVIQNAGTESLPRGTPAALKKAIGRMSEHFGHSVDIDQIARDVGASRRSLERMFQKHTGLTPSRYFKLQRLERARDLLLHSDMSLIDIAIATGFQSGPYFSVCFSGHFGVAPSVFRAQVRHRQGVVDC